MFKVDQYFDEHKAFDPLFEIIMTANLGPGHKRAGEIAVRWGMSSVRLASL